MANTDGQIVLGLDIPKTVKQINADIKKLQNQLKQVKATGALDTSSTVKKINAQIAALQSQLKTIDGKGINTDKLNADVKTLANNLKSFSSKNAGFDSFKTEINGVEVSLDSLINKLSTVDNVTDLSAIRSQAAALETAFTELAQINEIQLSMDNGYGTSEYQNQINKTIESLKRYGAETQTIETINSDLQSTFDSMKGLSGQQLSNQADIFRQKLDAAKVSIDEAKLSYDKLLQPVPSTKQVNLTNKIEKWLSDNSRATKSARQELELYLKELSSGSINQEQYNKFSNRLSEIDTEMRSMDKLGKSLFQSLSEGAKKFISWISSNAIVMKIITITRQAISTVTNLDTALVDLKKTAKMSASELENFYLSANDSAKQMGVTTKEIIEQAAAWSRLGFNTADAATKMAKYSSMFAAISPGMSLDSAAKGLVSIMNAFKIGLEDADEVVDGIISKINIIGNTQTVSNSDIVDFLTQSSSAMAEANNTLEDTIALGTAITKITGDASEAGQVLKTVSMRVRGYDEETGEFIGNVEELSGKIADLTQTASTPGGISLFSDETKTEYKSTRQLLQEISEIYDQLENKDQVELLDFLADKQNGQTVAAILNNFDTVTSSLESMANSAGNAEAEMAVVMDSIDYKLNRVKETGTRIAQNLFGREDIKTVLDGIGSIGNGLDWLTEKLGLFKSIGLGAGIFGIFKNVDYLKTPVCPLYI